jgi:hypothetical protein
MTKKSKQLLFAAPLLAASLLTFSAFTKAPKTITNGGGIAGGIHFNYTAVADKNGTYTGHYSWAGETMDIVCVYRNGNAASIYLSDGTAVNVVDSKAGDSVTEPFVPDTWSCGMVAATVNPVAIYTVTEGNLTVHK